MSRANGLKLVVAAAAWSLIAAIACRPAMADVAQSRSDISASTERGRVLYRRHCQACHGPSGFGDGPVGKDLLVRPADLTRIARRHDGAFPLEYVRKAIDGRQYVRSHGASDMPVWGLSFQDLASDASQEAAVRSLMDDLVQYVRSLQVDRPSSGGARGKPKR